MFLLLLLSLAVAGMAARVAVEYVRAKRVARDFVKSVTEWADGEEYK